MFTISSLKSIENKHNGSRSIDCMKKFCKYLRKHAMTIIKSEKKKMKLLTNKQQKTYENTKICYISKEVDIKVVHIGYVI